MFLYLPFKQRIHSSELGAYVSYGISAFRLPSFRTISVVTDVSLDLAPVLRLAFLCTTMQLDPVHLLYVVQDSLA